MQDKLANEARLEKNVKKIFPIVMTYKKQLKYSKYMYRKQIGSFCRKTV
jgi:hypothetical protein